MAILDQDFTRKVITAKLLIGTFILKNFSKFKNGFITHLSKYHPLRLNKVWNEFSSLKVLVSEYKTFKIKRKSQDK